MNVNQKLYALFLVLLLAIIPFMGVDLPRWIAFIPSLTGLIFVALYRPVYGQWPALPKAPFILAGSITGLCLLSWVWAIAPDVTLERTIKIGGLLLSGTLLPCLALQVKGKYIKPYIGLFAVSVIAALFLLAWELNLGEPLYRTTRGIPALDEVNHSVYNRGTVIIVLFLFASSFFMKRAIKHPSAPYLTYGLFGALLFWIVGMGESQSAQLALLLGVAAYVVAPYAPRFLWIGAGVLIAALIFIAPFVMPWVFDHFVNDIDNLPFLGGEAGSAGPRLEIWDFVSRYALHSPLYGYGVEATRTITDFDTQKLYHADSSILHPHNFALQLWMEFGALGALAGSLFCGYILKIIYAMRKTESRSIALASFIATLSISSMAYGMWQSWWIGLLIAVASLCILARQVELDQ